MIDRFEHFTSAMNEISKLWRKIASEEMEKHGLKASHAVYFTVLAKHPEMGLTAARIGEACGRDKADVSRMIGMMESKGLLIKEGSHQNHYNGAYKLTEKGFVIAQCVQQRASKAVSIAGKDLTEEQRRIFYAALDSIAANMRELSMKGIPE